jgi:anti-sigma B factor antagonist
MAISSVSPSGFSISVVPGLEEVTVVPAGDLDVASAGLVEHEVNELRRLGVGHVVIDLRQVDFIDSRGLQLLLVLRNAAKRDRQTLTLVPGPDRVQRLFALTATAGLFDWA